MLSYSTCEYEISPHAPKARNWFYHQTIVSLLWCTATLLLVLPEKRAVSNKNPSLIQMLPQFRMIIQFRPPPPIPERPLTNSHRGQWRSLHDLCCCCCFCNPHFRFSRRAMWTLRARSLHAGERVSFTFHGNQNYIIFNFDFHVQFIKCRSVLIRTIGLWGISFSSRS